MVFPTSKEDPGLVLTIMLIATSSLTSRMILSLSSATQSPTPKAVQILLLSTDIWHAMEFPMLLVYRPTIIKTAQPLFSLATAPSPFQLGVQIACLLFVELVLQAYLLGPIARMVTAKAAGSKADNASTAYNISWELIRIRTTFGLGCFILGMPAGWTAHIGLMHGLTIGAWMISRRAVFMM
ncbi:hypothetical protein CC80DRAFT_599309 [Byssothecium circinans]|uniref:Uncharacterized protein n=1 Tax=Byssothecium circinans TaxID=147558 RepID=A0A6A5T9Y6_9PLEO|nr:hypothetical protein CC80DRAFT_599309 [Byssothecium circinans]